MKFVMRSSSSNIRAIDLLCQVHWLATPFRYGTYLWGLIDFRLHCREGCTRCQNCLACSHWRFRSRGLTRWKQLSKVVHFTTLLKPNPKVDRSFTIKCDTFNCVVICSVWFHTSVVVVVELILKFKFKVWNRALKSMPYTYPSFFVYTE